MALIWTAERAGSSVRRRAGLIEQLGMTADGTQVGAWIGFEPVQALLAIGAQPAIKGAAGVLTLAAIRVLVQLTSQRADDRSAFGGTQSRADRFSDDAVAEQGDGFGRFGGHPDGPPGGDAAIQSAPASAAQGEFVWVASAWPPLMQLQNDHTLPPPMRSPNRTRARCHARCNTSNATRVPMVCRSTSTGVPSRLTASEVQWASSVGDRTRKRSHHVRTVVCGTSSRAAIGRRPDPWATFRTIAEPMTVTTSSRRASVRSGNSACVRRHAAQRAR